MNKTPIVIVLGVLVVILAIIFWPRGGETANLDVFAQCLADRGAVMYGAEWCSHCKEQKRLFGDSWKLVPYVECPDNTSLCLEKGVEGYPTWLIGTSTRLVGTQSLEKLSEATACIFTLEKQSQ
jgi:hypothetical protein